MKTLTEIQTEMNQISKQLDGLATEISAINTKVDSGRQVDFKALYSLGKRHPINNHPLAQQDAYIYAGYFTLLMCLALMAQTNQEKGLGFIQRIICGINCPIELENLLVDAGTINENNIDEFTMEINNSCLVEPFILDAMLVYIACENKDQAMLDFMANLFQLLTCTDKMIAELSELAKILSVQDWDLYGKFRSVKREIAAKNLCYYNDFEQDVDAETGKDMLYIYNDVTNIVNLIKGHIDKVIILNYVTFNKGGLYLHYMDIADDTPDINLKFSNCSFENIISDTHPIFLGYGGKILFENCIFKNLKATDADFSIIDVRANCITFKNCVFYCLSAAGINSNQQFHFSWEYTTFIDCKFISCRIDDESVIKIYTNTEMIFANCTRFDCTYVDNNGNILDDIKFDESLANYQV